MPEHALALGCQHEEAAVGPVDVQPQALVTGEIGQAVQIVDRAGVGRPSTADDHEGLQAGLAIGPYGLCKVRQRDAKTGVGGQAPDLRAGEPGGAGRATHRVVALVRHVDHTGKKILRQSVDTGRDDGHQVRHRSTCCEHAAGRVRHLEDVAQPAHDVPLQADESRRHRLVPGVPVDALGDEVGQGGLEQPAPWHVPKVARPGGVHTRRQDVVEEVVQQGVQRLPGSGQHRHRRNRHVAGGTRRDLLAEI